MNESIFELFLSLPLEQIALAIAGMATLGIGGNLVFYFHNKRKKIPSAEANFPSPIKEILSFSKKDWVVMIMVFTIGMSFFLYAAYLAEST